MPPALRLIDLRKSYGTRKAVDGLSLTVGRGEIFGLLGPNGAGKSTTVALAVGLLVPDSGSVDVLGAGSPANPEVRRRIGVAPQALALYDALTGEENLRFFGAIHGLSGTELDRRVDEALALVVLSDRRKDRAGGYSGGMKRRLNLAAALLHRPELLLLDEPTAGVDPQSRNAIFESVLALRKSGTTVVYTTHYMEEAERLCDRVAIVDAGRVLALDSVPKLLETHAGEPTLVVGVDGEELRIRATDPLSELNRIAKERAVSRFNVERGNLESVFLHLTGRSLRDE
jgi:ABC-2 type transport system ATP-binding protein